MSLGARYAQIQVLLSNAILGVPLPVSELEAGIDFAKQALGAARADQAVQVLEALTNLAPEQDQLWYLLGFAYREEQRMAKAAAALARAVELQPDNHTYISLHAQTRYESGIPAAQQFRRALNLAHEDVRALRGLALALAAEGRGEAAQELLVGTLLENPAWIEGHQCLASLRWTAGDQQGFASSYVGACNAQPKNLALRLAWFRAIAQARDWEGARHIIAEGERIFGATRDFTVAKLFIASESGDRAQAEQLFEQTATLRDAVRDIAWVRHCLRTQRPEQAEAVALELLNTPSAAVIWPYLALIWRLRGDARADWLDGAPPCIRVFDLDISPAEWDELGELLRRLHTARSPYLEQSVRGGTQTNGQLFFRPEPIIHRVKTQVEAAIREYIAALPDPVPGHPLLGPARDRRILYSGSWSVRLQGSGFHVSHTHAMGWISSALYVALPEPGQLGAAPAGQLSFGTPPPELGLSLPAYQQVEPKRGRLVLFPSTLWHCTLPFNAGERLTIAFDVKNNSPGKA